MNTKPRIEIQKIRSFGDVLGDAFKVVFRNYQVFGKALLIYVFPVFILSSIGIYFLGQDAANAMLSPNYTDPMAMIKSLGLGMALFYIGMFLCMFFVFHITGSVLEAMKITEIDPVPYDLFQEKFSQNFGSNILAYLTTISFVIISFLLGVFLIMPLFSISPFLGGVAGVGLFVFFMWISTIAQFPMFIENDKKIGPIQAIRNAFTLIKGSWWKTFGMILLMGIIISIIGYIFVMPFQIISVSRMVTSGLDGTDPALGSIGALSLIFSLLGSIITYTVYFSGIGLYYYSMIELKEGGSLFDKINTIGTKEDSFFENEGEF